MENCKIVRKAAEQTKRSPGPPIKNQIPSTNLSIHKRVRVVIPDEKNPKNTPVERYRVVDKGGRLQEEGWCPAAGSEKTSIEGGGKGVRK